MTHTLPCSPRDPYNLALHWLNTQFGHPKYRWTRLICWQDTWYSHQRVHGTSYSAWQECSDGDIKNALWRYLGTSVWEKPDTESDGTTLTPCVPNTRMINDVHNAAKALAVIDDVLEPPVWLGGSYETGITTFVEYGEGDETAYAPDYVATASGILNINTRTHWHGNRLLFTLSTLPFRYDPAATCPKWGDFLRSVWMDDDESIETLQEIFGYILSGSNAHQKIFLLVGPPRAGKGTITKVLQALVGEQNVTSPTMASLSRNFGLAPLVGKTLAVVGDARLDSAHRGQIQLVERLLTISGDDELTIDRKFKSAWHGRLAARFMIVTNELPTLHDASAAIVRRLVPLQLTTSFLGREDTDLAVHLKTELPGILNWALEGWDRLCVRGKFQTVGSVEEITRHMEDLASPVSAFLHEWGHIGPEYEVTADELWRAWYRWSSMANVFTGDQSNLGKQLRAVVPTLSRVRRGEGKDRYYLYKGLGLAEIAFEKMG